MLSQPPTHVEVVTGIRCEYIKKGKEPPEVLRAPYLLVRQAQGPKYHDFWKGFWFYFSKISKTFNPLPLDTPTSFSLRGRGQLPPRLTKTKDKRQQFHGAWGPLTQKAVRHAPVGVSGVRGIRNANSLFFPFTLPLPKFRTELKSRRVSVLYRERVSS